MGLKQLVTVIALLLTLAAGVVAYLLVGAPAGSQAPQYAMLLPARRELPAFTLLDQQGRSVGRDVFEGHWNLVFFGFTFCPDICPTTLQVLSDARKQLADQGVRPLPRIVLVSVDPERDTPERIGAYLDYFGDGNLGLTGELAEIRKLTDALGIFFEKSASEDENYLVNHSAVVLVIDPAGRFHALFSAPHRSSNFLSDLPGIMSDSAADEVLPPLVARDVFVTQSMPGMKMSAGYLTLVNNTDVPVRITRVSSPDYSSVEMHETVIENDVARMIGIPELIIDARSAVTFERGGKHLMLMRPTDNDDEVRLSFHSGNDLLLTVTTTRQPR